MKSEIAIDTGPIVAILSRNDIAHTKCLEALRGIKEQLVTTWPVITEAQWLLREDPRAVQALFTAARGGLWQIVSPADDALTWVPNFLKKYQDREAQLADASLAYLCDKRDIATIFTLDRKDFQVYRRSRKRAFEIIP